MHRLLAVVLVWSSALLTLPRSAAAQDGSSNLVAVQPDAVEPLPAVEYIDSVEPTAYLWQQPAAQPAFSAAAAAAAVPRRRQSNIRLASVPNMFGDTTDGGCGGLFIAGALVASAGHPTYGCSRLNIAENNSPIVRNRVYYAYRHFESATDLDVFSYSPQGREGHVDIDRHLLGFESKIGDGTSVELRIPINTELNSKINIVQTDSGTTTDGSNNNLDAIFKDRTTSLGNLDIILKTRIMERETFYLSAGLGINLPTAPDVRVTGHIDDPNYQLYDPGKSLEENRQNGPENGPVLPNGTGDAVKIDFVGVYRNQTVNLLPFVAFVWTPTDEWFLQGFGQIDVAANESTGSLAFQLNVAGIQRGDINNPLFDRLALQTLMRLNYGIGRWLYLSDEGLLNALGVLFEVHYSTTLNDSDIASLTVFRPGQIPLPVVDRGISLGFGNLANRIDIVNGVVGVPIHMGMTSIYNGFAFPLGPQKGFDFEYLLAINRRF